jgi:sugar O-acyltransferase (sialic acid O-acetyltransferase NeuD family)
MVLGIYGAGGLGREVYELANIINSNVNCWDEIFFIDDGDLITNPRNILIVKFENLKNSFNQEKVEVCIAIGEPLIRKDVFDKLCNNNMRIATLVHPEIYIPKSTVVGKGTIINKYTSVSCDIVVGENVYVHPMACIGHDSIIGNHTIISSFVDVAGDCKVGDCAFLAINVIMKQGTSIGSNSIVGLASVVHRDIKEGVIALGNPARPMKNNENLRVFSK